MKNLNEQFRHADRIPVSDLWSEIAAREPRDLPPPPQRRLVALLVALFLGGLAVAIAVFAFSGARSERRENVGSTPPVELQSNGLIAVGCGEHICTMSADGARPTDLNKQTDPNLVLVAYSPVWSPDGTKIAFYGYPRGGASVGANYDIYTMNADGSEIVNLTTNTADIRSGSSQLDPRWSPDGSLIAFDGEDGVYVMNSDGSEQRKVSGGGHPSWSPDGTRIAFSMYVAGGGTDLYIVRPDGTGLEQLTTSPGAEELPSWSPDGSRIAFLQAREIFVIDADGTAETPVFDVPDAHPYQPMWSPDGTHLAFEARVGNSYDIYAVNAEGSDLTDLTPTPDRNENDPVWSPDGTSIAFEATHVTEGDNTGTFDVYVMNSAGRSEVRLSNDLGARGHGLSWQAKA